MKIKDYKKREKWCDIAKGIVIILMIIGHMPNYIPSFVRELIYSFHMPFFFIISGYWFKKEKYSLKDYTIEKIKHLLVPYLIFSIVFLIISLMFSNYSNNDIEMWLENIFIWGNGISILWFFMALFGVEIIYYCISKYLSYYSRIMIIIFSSLIGMLLYNYDIVLPLKLDTIFTSLIFLEIGQMLNKNLKIISGKGKIIENCIIFMFAFIIGYMLNKKIWELGGNICPNLFIGLITATLGTILVIMLSIRLERYKKMKLFEIIGKNSLIIYPLSKFVPDIIEEMQLKFNISIISNALIEKILIYIISFMIIALIVFCYNMRSKILKTDKKIIGEKDEQS